MFRINALRGGAVVARRRWAGFANEGRWRPHSEVEKGKKKGGTGEGCDLVARSGALRKPKGKIGGKLNS